VPRESLLDAVRLNSMQFTAARAIGPAFAGVVLRTWGPGGAFLGNAVSFLVVLAALAVIRPGRQQIAAGTRRFRDEFRHGLRYVRDKAGLWQPIVTVLAMSTFGSSVVQLAVGFSRDEFGKKESGFGFLIAVFGAGAIVASAVLLVIADRVRRSRTALTGLWLTAAGVFLLSVAPSYGYGLLALFVMGLAWVMSAVSLNTAIQSKVADEFRGRVMSLYLMGLQAGVPLGALVQGRLGDRFGLRPVVRGSAVVLAAYGLFALLVLGGLRALDGDRPSEPSYTAAR
jgi:predicted MFS family arabinose efflux permease